MAQVRAPPRVRSRVRRSSLIRPSLTGEKSTARPDHVHAHAPASLARCSGRIAELALSLGAESVCARVPDGDLHLAVAALTPSGAMNAVTAAIVRHTAEGVDVVKPAWLEACAAAGRRVPLEPSFVVHASAATRSAFPRWVDAWGGSLVRPLPLREFAAYWQGIPVDPRVAVSSRDADAALAGMDVSVGALRDRRLEALQDSALASSRLCATLAAELPPGDAADALRCVRRPGTFRGRPSMDTTGEISPPAAEPQTGLDPVVVYFFHPSAASALPTPSVGSWSRIHATLVLAGGGLVAASLEPAADGPDVVVVQRAEVTRGARGDLAPLKALLRGRAKVPAVVWSEWIVDSSASRAMKAMRPYACEL